MPIPETMLEEHSRALRAASDRVSALQSLENYLHLEYGWTPPIVIKEGEKEHLLNPEKMADLCAMFADVQKNPPPGAVDGDPKPLVIPYAKEAEHWLETVSGEFTTTDFRKWLETKYGEGAVKDASARGPFPTLIGERKIEVVGEPGRGRRATKYRKAA